MAFQRKQFDTVLGRIKEPRGKIQVVIGPRCRQIPALVFSLLASTCGAVTFFVV